MATATAAEPAGLALRHDGDVLRLVLTGDWTIQTIGLRDAELSALECNGASLVSFDLAGLGALDTAGAWLLRRTAGALEQAGARVETLGGTPVHEALFAQAASHAAAPPPPSGGNLFAAFVQHVGRATIETLSNARDLVNFLGLTVIVLGRALVRPRRLRFTSLVYHIEKTGIDALPIVGLLSFLIGVVLAYQGADQLARFGAQVFTVNLVGVSVLREMGILLTAIIVAGRSGSAFTAQIGTMRVNEEIDALRTIGIDPIEALVLPRVVALVLVLPLLTFYADIAGIFGGAVMVYFVLDINFAQFIRQLHEAVGLSAFLVGLVKAPIFAFVIALVGCFEGLKVSRSAESVGLHTTRAVVEAIFLVIVFDALFSIFFSVVGW
jgi:phospholipid/cholesterol/gamma-HCH transport system permease protein